MRQTPDLSANLEGPVRYDPSCDPGRRRNILRHGSEGADLWSGQVVWQDAASAKYFSVIVMDQNYLEQCQGHRRTVQDFETFVVGLLQGSGQGADRVYEWRTTREHTWRDRGRWLLPFGDVSDVHRRQAVDALGKHSRHLLHDLGRLFAAPDVARASRRGRRGAAARLWGLHEAARPPRRPSPTRCTSSPRRRCAAPP